MITRRKTTVSHPGKSALLAGFFLVLAAWTTQAAAQPSGPATAGDLNPEHVTFSAPDGVVMHGDVYEAESDVTILLFHQGGSNVRGEYVRIIPSLLDAGYRVAAFDLRQGGQWYGSWNRTVADYPAADTYCEAAPDIESAVAYARERWADSGLVLWGSSYSATLVIRQAGMDARDIRAVLSFSPASGDPMEGCRPEEVFDRLDVPLLVLRPPSEAQNPAVQEQLRLAEAAGHETYVPEHGAHGSSMLDGERIGADVAPTWERVLGFIAASVR